LTNVKKRRQRCTFSGRKRKEGRKKNGNRHDTLTRAALLRRGYNNVFNDMTKEQVWPLDEFPCATQTPWTKPTRWRVDVTH